MCTYKSLHNMKSLARRLTRRFSIRDYQNDLITHINHLSGSKRRYLVKPPSYYFGVLSCLLNITLIVVSLNSFRSNDWIQHRNKFSKPGFRTSEKFAKSGLFFTECDNKRSICQLESDAEFNLKIKLNLDEFSKIKHLSRFKHYDIKLIKVFPYCDNCHVDDAIKDSRGSMKIILWARYNNLFSFSMFFMLLISCFCSLVTIFPKTTTGGHMKSSLIGCLCLITAGIFNALQLVVYISCEPMISKSKGDFRYGQALKNMALVFLFLVVGKI